MNSKATKCGFALCALNEQEGQGCFHTLGCQKGRAYVRQVEELEKALDQKHAFFYHNVWKLLAFEHRRLRTNGGKWYENYLS